LSVFGICDGSECGNSPGDERVIERLHISRRNHPINFCERATKLMSDFHIFIEVIWAFLSVTEPYSAMDAILKRYLSAMATHQFA
jgi:hypothetical protein